MKNPADKVMRYRYVDFSHSNGDVKIQLRTYLEVRKTPKGAWVVEYEPNWFQGQEEHFVLDGFGKRLCHQTKELAWSSFIARKQRQLQFTLSTAKRVQTILKSLRTFDTPPEKDIVLSERTVEFIL